MRNGLSYSEAGKIGWKKTVEKRKAYRKKRRDKYQENPSYCKTCSKKLPFEKRSNKFCSHSCAAKHNNLGVVRNSSSGKFSKKACENCGKETTNPKFCSLECCYEYPWSQKKKRFEKTGKFSDSKSDDVIRKDYKRYLLEKRGVKCEICGIEEWQEKPVPLVLDHISGDPYDHHLKNLRLICGNCDMQLPTYKGRNFGNGRKYRRKKR